MKKPALLFLSFIPAVDESNSAPEILAPVWLPVRIGLWSWCCYKIERNYMLQEKIEIA